MEIDETLVKPCPFCGKKPAVRSDYMGGPPSVYFIECQSDECDINPYVWSHDDEVTLQIWNSISERKTEEQAEAAWNRRGEESQNEK